jgi:hypothetical protein
MSRRNEPAPLDSPRSLRHPAEVEARSALLAKPHMVPLRDYVAALRASSPEIEFPDFDPLDGGINAEILFLFEKPGRMTSKSGKGSGFISRNNDDSTAQATFGFMIQIELPRGKTVSWNAIPGWNGTRTVTQIELKNGIKELIRFLRLLPRIKTIVLVGLKAQRALPLVQALGYKVTTSAHPSPLVRARYPKIWEQIPMEWAKAVEDAPI